MTSKSSKAGETEVGLSLSKLTLEMPKDTTKSTKPKVKKKKEEVIADSWEDEDVSDSPKEEQEDGAEEASSEAPTPQPPNPPPPTPLSPGTYPHQEWGETSSSRAAAATSAEGSARRPEKTDAVARRMIAAGLGLKAPKQTEEQRAYQRSIREQEKKRREQEQLEEQRKKEEIEKAKQAVWDD